MCYLNYMQDQPEDTLAEKQLHIRYLKMATTGPLCSKMHMLSPGSEECQRAGDRLKKATLPLQLVIIEVPFQQWGLDIVGPIAPASS